MVPPSGVNAALAGQQLPEFAFQEFSVGVPDQRLARKVWLDGNLEGHQSGGDGAAKLLRAAGHARFQRGKGIGLLAQCLAQAAEERSVHHRGVFANGVIDLDAIDVYAAVDEHVLGTVDDEAKAFVIDLADVAGAHPAVDESRRARLGIVPVTLDHVRAVALGSGLIAAARR